MAIKLPHPHLISRTVDVEAYLTEARTVAGLDHPHIVPVYDVGSTPEFPVFVVSKFIDGSDLAKRMLQARSTLQETVELIACVAEALHHAHKQGLVHRDIKPANLLLDRHGTVWVTDLGLAKSDEHQNLTATGEILGTLRYLPPEAFAGKADRRSDVYSLGLTLFELLALRPAHDAPDCVAPLVMEAAASEVP